MTTLGGPPVTVVGAGASGLALAARAALRGHAVTIANRPGPRIDALASGRLVLTEPDGTRHTVAVSATPDVAAAVRGAPVVILAVGSSHQSETLCAVGDALSPDQVVLLVPGHTGGAWCASAAIRAGGHPVPRLAEMPLPFVCRQSGPAQIAILQDKAEVHLGADLPDRAAARAAAEQLGFPITHECGLLEAGMRNTTAVLQPVLLLANLTRVDRAETFTIYREGVGPALGRLAAALDAERLAVAAAYGLAPPSLADWLRHAYGATGRELHELVASVPGYARVVAPTEVRHRFLVEHVETGVVPLAELGALAGVATPRSSAVIELASAATGLPLRETGRTLRRLLPPGVAPENARHHLTEGVAA